MRGLDRIGDGRKVDGFLRVVDKGVMMERRSRRRVGECTWRRRRWIRKMRNSWSIGGGREEGVVRVRVRGRRFEELLHIELIEIAARRAHRPCRR